MYGWNSLLCAQGFQAPKAHLPSLIRGTDDSSQTVEEPDAWKQARPVCAVRRVVVSLLQAGGTEEKFLGYWHIWKRKRKETKHAREAMHARKRCRAGHSYDPLPRSKAVLPEFES